MTVSKNKGEVYMSIGIGILGFAHGHVNHYCQVWQENQEHQISLKAGWDHDATRLNQAIQSYGIVGYQDVEQLLSNPEIQAVVIASETSMHADLVERAAAAGKAIVLQKPIALTLSEADRIVEAVQRFKVPFTMAWQMRVDPQNLQMKTLLESGQFGKVFMVRRRHGLSLGLNESFKDSWHVDPKYNRDIWADDASHAIDFIHWLLHVPESVTAEIESLHNNWMPMNNGIAIFRYPGGPIAEVSSSFTCLAAENTVEIVCENGTIIQSYGDAPSCNITRESDKGLKWFTDKTNQWTYSEILTPSNHSERIRGLSGPLADFLNGKREPLATAEEGRTSLQMVLACYVSVREGRRVALDDVGIKQI
jgi:predicted dehydrogenase